MSAITQIYIILVGISMKLGVTLDVHHAINISGVLPAANEYEHLPLSNWKRQSTISYYFEDSLSRTLKEIFDGPLANKPASLLIDRKSEEVLDLDLVLSIINNPITIIRVSKTDSASTDMDSKPNYLQSFDNGDFTKEITTTTESQFKNSIDMINEMENLQETTTDETFVSESHENQELVNEAELIFSGHVLIYIIGEMVTESLLNQQKPTLQFSALLVIFVSRDCPIELILQTPVAHETRSVALLCPINYNDTEKDKVYHDFRIYSWKPFQSENKMVSLGLWSPSTLSTWDDLFVDRFSSFQGSALHISSDTADTPFFYMDTDEEYEGISKRLIDALSRALNFTFTLTQRAQDGRWGSYVNATWVGMLGEVYRGEKDFTINSFAITEERSKDFQFSVPFYRAGFGFNILEPPPLASWRNLMYPLTLNVWISTALTLVIISLVFYLLIHIREKDYRSSPFSCFILVTMGLMKQAATRVPKSWVLRLFLGFWWIGAYVIIVFYNSNLIAILTIPTFPAKIETIQQLAESNHILCMLDYGEFVPEALATSLEPNLFALGSKLDLVPMLDEEWDGDLVSVERTLTQNYVHLDFVPYLQNLYNILGYSDKVYTLPDKIYESNMAFFFKKNTPWVYKFDQGIQRLVEANLIDKWLGDILRKRKGKSKKEPSDSPDKPLKLSHLQGPFLIFAIGMCFSAIIFLVEFLNIGKCCPSNGKD